MMGVIAFFAGLVLIGTVVDITINILNLDEVFSENFVQHFQGFSLYTNTIKLFHCPEPGAPGSLDCINGIRFGSDKRRFSSLILFGARFCLWSSCHFVYSSGFFPCPGSL